MKQILTRSVRYLGYDIIRYKKKENAVLPPDLTDDEKEIYAAVAPFTRTSIERIITLIQATKYVIENKIEGDFVECGVWRGGSMMAVAHILKHIGDTTRKLYLYDTFTGMPPPTEKDMRYDGTFANDLLNATSINTGNTDIWCYADKTDVTKNLLSTGYPESNLFFVEGKVEETIPQTMPDQICLLRLDTDWYESTKHELTHLYPKLVRNGVLIIDDYGYWQGAKEATDEYFRKETFKPFLQRVDSTGRVTVKI